MPSAGPEGGTKWTEQKWETGNRREEEDKNNKRHAMCPFLWYFPLLRKIPPSLTQAPPPSTVAPPSPPHWSARSPPQSHKLPGCEPIQGERGSQHQPPGTKAVGDDPQSVRWTLAGLTRSSALTLSAFCACPAIMSSSSANIHHKRLPCKFSKPSHLLQTAVLYFNSSPVRI